MKTHTMKPETKQFPLNRENSFTFASFTFPKFVWTLPQCTRAKRLERYKRPVCGPYSHAPKPNACGGCFFYLGNDFMPGLRWSYCDEVDGARIAHRGWYTSEDCHQTIRGIVARLPKGRGFLAGWTMGESMASELENTIHCDEVQAARAADRIAEMVAEKEREYREREDERQRLEDEMADAARELDEKRVEARALISDIRESKLSPGLCERMKQELRAIRAAMHRAVRTINQNKKQIATL